MHFFARFRTLLSQSFVWIVLPLALALFATIGAGVYVYRQTMVSLLIDRDRQLATLSATRVSEAVEGYARVLEALASSPALRSAAASERASALEGASEALEIFNAGVVIFDANGQRLTTAPAGATPLGGNVAGSAYFETARTQHRPAFSDVLTDAGTGQDIVVVAAPLLGDNETFHGVLAGAVYLHNTPLGEPVRRLSVGDEGFAYLVDGRGRVIFHPQPEFIGADFTDRPFVLRVISGESGGTVWTNLDGERVVQGYAPVPATGWGIIVREPWSAVVQPASRYGVAVTMGGLAAVMVAGLLLWQGVRRIARPVQRLAAQTARLAAGHEVEPLPDTGIVEVDQLETAFAQMARQIAAYRAGLRRYVGALTTAREEEQQRLARELHDDTIQSLLALLRRIELYQANTADSAHRTRLGELKDMVADTLQGVRQISRDLRPLALEDLGLSPALRALVQGWSEEYPIASPVRFQLAGSETLLSQDQEMAVYRITQEALANIRKHARASQVQVQLAFEPDQVSLEVRDNGVGFEVPAALAELAQRGHFGLMGMQERAWAAGGHLALESVPGTGTRLRVTLPLNGHAVAATAPVPTEA